MQGGPFAGGAAGGDFSRCQFFGEQGKADVDVAQLQADVAGTDEGVEAAAAQKQHVYADRGGGFVFCCGGGYVGKGDAAGFLFKAKAAGYLDEAEDVDFEVAGGPGKFPLPGVKVQGQAAWIGGGAGVDGKVLHFVVGKRAVCCGAVDGDAEGVGGDGQAVNADEGGATGARLQGGPCAQCVAGGFKAGALFAGHGKTKFDAAKA